MKRSILVRDAHQLPQGVATEPIKPALATRKSRIKHAFLVACIVLLVAIGAFTTNALVKPQTAHASVAASQLDFLDYRGTIYSIYIQGPNQNGVWTAVCWSTPGFSTITSGWWWSTRTYVNYYTGSGCSSGYVGQLWFDSDGATYRCLEDVSPYSDWDC